MAHLGEHGLELLEDHHDLPCTHEACWRDHDGTEYHPGSAVGVYIVDKKGRVYIVVESDLPDLPSLPSTRGVSRTTVGGLDIWRYAHRDVQREPSAPRDLSEG